MNGKTWIYSSLVVLILAVMGIGIWFVMHPSDPVEIPENEPVVLMDISNPEQRTLGQLSLYEDGTVIFVEDSGLKTPVTPGDEFTRTWRTGKLKARDIESFFSYLGTVNFSEVKTTFISPDAYGESETGGVTENRSRPGFNLGEYLRLSVDNGTIKNTVVAIGYFVAGSGAPYSELPYPLDYLYDELEKIIEDDTREVLVETIKR